MKKFICLFLLFGFSSWASAPIQLNLTKTGIHQILSMALSLNNLGKLETPSAKIQPLAIQQTIKSSNLNQNEVIKIVDEISSLDFNKDFKFNIISSEIEVKGKVLPSDVTIQVLNYTETGFDVLLALSIDQLQINSKSIDLCEQANLKTKKCSANTLSAKIKNLTLKESSNSKKIQVTAKLRANIIKDSVTFIMKEIKSNLDESFASALVLNFTMNMPPLKIKINGQEALMSMDHIADRIKDHQKFLAMELINFSVNYLSKDLITLLNGYFKKIKLPSQINDNLVNSNFDNNQTYEIRYNVAVDNTYVHNYHQYQTFKETNINTKLLGDSEIVTTLAQMINSASFEVELEKIFTTKAGSIRSQFDGDLIIDGQSLPYVSSFRIRHWEDNYKNIFGTTSSGFVTRTKNITNPSFQNIMNRKYGVAVSIADPVINSILKAAEKHNLFTRTFRAQAGEMADGIYVNAVHFHMQPRRKIETGYIRPKLYVVAEIKVDVANVHTKKWYEWLAKKVGGLLEGNVYFPLQFAVTPNIVTDNLGKKTIKLEIDNPLNSLGDPINDFGYYSDFDKDNIYGVVRSEFRTQLKNALFSATKPITIDLDSIMGKNGIKMEPVDIDVEETGNMVLYLNLNQLDHATLLAKDKK